MDRLSHPSLCFNCRRRLTSSPVVYYARVYVLWFLLAIAAATALHFLLNQ